MQDINAALFSFFSSLGISRTTGETLAEIGAFAFTSHATDRIEIEVTAEAEAVTRGRSLAFTAHAEHARFAYAFGRACARFQRQARTSQAILRILAATRVKVAFSAPTRIAA